MAKIRTDTERLDAIEDRVQHGACPGIINDDDGRWAVAEDGVQDVSMSNGPFDLRTSFFVRKAQWRNTIREAIDAYLDEGKADG